MGVSVEVCRCLPPRGSEERLGLLRTRGPGDPQQGIAVFSFPEALGLAGVRRRCTVSGEWLVDTRVSFCQSKLCVPLARASRSGEWI